MRKTINKEEIMKSFTEFSESLNEKTTSVSDFVSALQSTFDSNFPKSWSDISSGKKGSIAGAGDVSIRFTIGDKSDWSNGILQNDPFFTTLHVFGLKDGEDFATDKKAMELGTGKTITVDNTATPSVRIKSGWRKKSATPDALIKHFDTYLKKLKVIASKNKDTLPGYVSDKV
jgi:hypothetical protein